MIEFIILLFLIGMAFGSFSNVCAYRIPHSISVVSPGSHCPVCKHKIRWYDNLPCLSFVLLHAQCRDCKAPIPVRYFAVELLSGLIFSLIGIYIGFDRILPLYLYLAFALITLTLIDYECKIIPDFFSLSLIIAGIIYAPFNSSMGEGVVYRVLYSAVGVLVGGGVLLLIGFIGSLILKKEAMGGGDIKLLAGLGAIFGWQKSLTILFLASLLGTIAGVYLIASKRLDKKEYIPFGPFIALSALIHVFLPDILLFWKF